MLQDDLSLQDDPSLAAMADTLARSTDYRVLRRLIPRTEFAPANGQPTRSGILLDVETTGLDQVRDEVIELAMIKFDYLPDGSITRVADVFTAFNEPSRPIPPEITELTGITDEIVAGHRIDPDAVAAFADDAVIVIAHNAGFDRKFSERYWPVFQHKAWGCSATEVDWRKHGFDGSRLGYLLAGAGFFHQAHRAIDDCHALLEILAFELPDLGAPALAVLAGARPQENDAGLGRAVAFRSQGRAEAARLSLERRLRRPAEVLVHRCRRKQGSERNRIPAQDDLYARRRTARAGAQRDEPVFGTSVEHLKKRLDIRAVIARSSCDEAIQSFSS
jgi:DNA polymerase-3 subunit epsilon